jgi:hypothetical protein
MLRAFVIATVIGASTVLLPQVSAYADEKWCASYDFAGSNCGWHSHEQCRATVSGIGGSCFQRD